MYVNQKRPSYIKAMEYSLCDAKAFHSAIEQYSHCNVENKESPTDCGWVVVVGTRCMATVKIQTNNNAKLLNGNSTSSVHSDDVIVNVDHRKCCSVLSVYLCDVRSLTYVAVACDVK